MHLSQAGLGADVGHLLLLLLLQTGLALPHLDVVLAAWRSKAWHLVEVQEEVQEGA